MGKHIHQSVILNWLGLAMRIGVSLVLLPYVVNTLGVESYGEYIFLVAMFGYSGVLEIGLRASILRYTGNLSGRGDFGLLNRILGTIFGYYCGVALLVGVAGLVLYLAPPEWILPVGASEDFPTYAGLAALVAGSAFFRIGWASVLRATERYDLVNLVEISGVLLRAGLIVFLLQRGYGVIAILAGDLLDNLYNATASRVALRRVAPSIRLDFSRLEKEKLREVLGYSGWAFLNSLAFQFRFRGPSIIVGGVLNTATAGFFGIAVRLQSYVFQLGTAMNGPFRARATLLAGRDGDHAVRPTVYQGTKYLTFVAGSICMLLYAHAHQLLVTWMGPEFHESAIVLRILLIGLTAEISGLMLGGALYATGRLRTLTISNLAEAVVIVVLGYFLARPFGLKGVAFAVSAAIVANKTVAQPLLLLGLLRIPLHEWITKVLWRPTLALFVGAWGVWATRAVWVPESLIGVILHLVAGGIVLLGAGWVFVFNREERARVLQSFGIGRAEER